MPCVCTNASALNRPGLPAIHYRIGTFGTFVRAMVDDLPGYIVTLADSSRVRPLAPLTARGDDDPSIALLDSFAVVCDVLAFYQERIANEGYLRTATERRSVLELAREIGYELDPGVAASTFVAFTVEDSPSAPKQAVIAAGTKIQSVPGPGELPAVFETALATQVRAEWNSLVPVQTHVQCLKISGDALYVDGNETREVYLAGTALNLKQGDALLFVQGGQALPLAISKITEDSANARTRVDVGDRLDLPVPVLPALPYGEVIQTPIEQTLANVKQYIVDQHWREDDLQAFLTVQKWDAAAMLVQVQTLLTANVPDAKVYSFGQRVGFFGASAPAYATLPIDPNDGHDPQLPKGFPTNWDDPPISIWRDGLTDLNPPNPVVIE